MDAHRDARRPGAPSDRAVELVRQMTVAEVVTVLSGSSDWETAAIERLGIPAVRLSDGPSGVRGVDWLTSTSWNSPCGSALGATWDRSIVEQVAQVLGRDARAKGVAVHLAPTLNLHRTPTGGRNFESFGEDPTLVGSLAVAYVRGVQDQGVASCPKHFVANDTETDRFTVDVQVDEATLHEVYLRPFEDALQDAGAGAVMVAYNGVNGALASESAELLTGVLRDDWQVPGPVISDWFCVRSTTDALVAGCDLEMPGPSKLRGPLLLEAIESGAVDERVARRAAERVVGLLLGAPEPRSAATTAPDADPGAAEVLRHAAAAAMVLLRNEARHDGRAVLPLDVRSLATVAVIGPNARTGQLNGGGSAIVRPRHPSHPLASLRARLPDTVEVRSAPGCSIDVATPLLDPALCGPMVLQLAADPAHGWTGSPDRELSVDTSKLLWFADPLDRPGPPRFAARLLTSFTPDRTGRWTFGVRSVGDACVRLDGEVLLDNTEVALPEIVALGKPEQVAEVDLTAGMVHQLDVRLVRDQGDDGLSALIVTAAPPATDDLLGEAVTAASGADVAVVVVGTNADWETEGRDRTTLDLPGDQDELVRRVAAVAATTIVVVNAGAPVALPWLDDVDAVLVCWFPGEAFGEALADVLVGDQEPAGRLPVTFPFALEDTPAVQVGPDPDGTSTYGEGRLVGHRWYDRRGIEPRFPFGYGLGYGSVELVEARTLAPHRIRVGVRGTGERPTTACVQVYARRLDGSEADEPIQQLIGFARHHVAPGQRTDVDVELHRHAFDRWSTVQHAWEAVPGPVELRIGWSSKDLPLRLVVDPGDTRATG